MFIMCKSGSIKLLGSKIKCGLTFHVFSYFALLLIFWYQIFVDPIKVVRHLGVDTLMRKGLHAHSKIMLT